MRERATNAARPESRLPRGRAIALWGSRGWGAQEEAQLIVIIERGPEFPTADAVARGAVMTQHIQGDATNHGQVLGRVIVARSTGLFAKLHIQDSVPLVFDAPVTARGGRKPIAIRERAQKVPVATCNRKSANLQSRVFFNRH